MKHVLAISHVAVEDLGTLGLELKKRDAHTRYIDATTISFDSLDPVAPDLIAILGGPIAVYDVELYPFLRHELEFITSRLTARRPTLGICLGAQLMAQAFGARVHPGAHGKEIGWARVAAGPDISKDPALRQLLRECSSFFHFHGDTFDLPLGAQHLASSEKYANQAFRVGDFALGIQFHPEVTAEGLERWYVGHAHELAASKIDIAALRVESLELAPQLERAARRFWKSWLDKLGL